VTDEPSNDLPNDPPTSGAPSDRLEAGSRSREAGQDATSPQAGGRGLGVLTLLIAIIALVLASRPFWSSGTDEAPAMADLAQVEALGERLDRMNLRLDDVAARWSRRRGRSGPRSISSSIGKSPLSDSSSTSFKRAQESDPGEFEALARRVGRLEGTQSSGEASLEARMGALEQRIEQRVAALQDQLGGLGADLETAAEDREQRLALVHARALMRKGRDDWMLNADADSAREAWSGAAARLGPIDTLPSELTDAMERLLRSAERLDGPRTAERVAALERLAASASTWPEALESDVSATAPGSEDFAEADGWRNRMAGAFNSLVTIESVDDASPTPLEIDRARLRVARTSRCCGAGECAAGLVDRGGLDSIIRSNDADLSRSRFAGGRRSAGSSR
jgi:hypothetical protein